MTNVEIDGVAMIDAVAGNPPTTRDTPPCRHCGRNNVRRPMHTLPPGRADAAEMSRLLEVVEIQDTLVTPTQQTDKVTSLLQLGRVCRNRDPEAGVMNFFKEISTYRKLEAKGKREQEPSQPWQVQCREDFYLTNLIQKAMEIARLEPDTKDIG